MAQVVIILCNCFMIMVTMQLYNDMLIKKTEKAGLKWCIGIGWILSTFFISEVFHLPILNFLLNLELLLLLTVTYKGSVCLKIWTAVLTACIEALCDYLSYRIMKSNMEEETAYVISYIVTVILFWLCERIASIIIYQSKGEEFSGKEFGILLSIPVCSLSVLVCVTYSHMNSVYAIWSSGGILIICFMSFYVYHYLVKNLNDKAERELLAKEIQWYSRELDRVRETELRIDGMRHDLKHHLIQIKDFASKNQKEQLINYINEWENDIPDVTKYSQSGQKEIDSLINYMLKEAEDELVKCEVKVSISHDQDINHYQISIVLGNLLENAIAAAKASVNKELKVFIEESQGLFFIEIGNSYNQSIRKKDGKFITTKDHAKGHGMGLENVKRIVKMNNGDIDIKSDKEWFQVKVMMYIQ